jgi:hypothetical protein
MELYLYHLTSIQFACAVPISCPIVYGPLVLMCVLVLTILYLKNAVFWDVALVRYCVNRRFGETYRLHLQGRRKTREQGTSVSRWLQPRWRQYVPPKRRFIQYLHGATSQKTKFFIVTAVKASILTIPYVSIRPSVRPSVLVRTLLETYFEYFHIVYCSLKDWKYISTASSWHTGVRSATSHLILD